jgi:hypothetical protein
VGTEIGYPRRMARAPWAPNDEQKKMLAALKALARRRDAVEAAYKKQLAECAAAGIPVARLADDLAVERKTVYRHLGRSMS